MYVARQVCSPYLRWTWRGVHRAPPRRRPRLLPAPPRALFARMHRRRRRALPQSGIAGTASADPRAARAARRCTVLMSTRARADHSRCASAFARRTRTRFAAAAACSAIDRIRFTRGRPLPLMASGLRMAVGSLTVLSRVLPSCSRCTGAVVGGARHEASRQHGQRPECSQALLLAPSARG